MRIALLALSAAFAAAPVLAQQPGVPAPEAAAATAAQASDEDVPVNQVLVYGEDPCPASTDEVINVCARLPEEDRFRIPPNLRQNPNDPAGQSWSNRAVELSYVGASGIGSCSPTGPGGASGCFNQIVQQARAERRNSDQINWNQMIEEARQERLRRIDEAIMEEERQGPE
ncbi:MAG: hypothetical protein ACT4N8_04855 [Sphingosinicella sp.]|uniref:hypothetical protein n=1 Tax=Sphingosinicella sp. TaxID=1917971 RepID=UPI004037A002